MNETVSPPELRASFKAFSTRLEAKAGKPVRVEILAYTGGPMQPNGFPVCIVNVDGLKFAEQITLLADHKSETSSVVGSGKPRVSGGQVFISGTLSEATEAGRQVIQLHRDGVRWEASIGLLPSGDFQTYRNGDRVNVNGRDIVAGPEGLRVYSGGELLETSIVSQGADRGGTQVAIAAQRKGIQMTEAAQSGDSQGAILAAFDRIEKFEDVLSADDARRLRASARGGLVGEAFEAEFDSAIKASMRDQRDGRELAELRASAPRVSPTQISGPSANVSDAWAASVVSRSCGEELAEKCYGRMAMEASRGFRGMSMVDGFLAATGATVSGDKTERLRAALSPSHLRASGFSTTSLPVALSDSMSRVLEVMYRDARPTWRPYASIKNADTFHEQTAVRPSAFANLDEVGAQGEVKHDSLTKESTYTWQLGTYAKTLKVSRQHLINDWLGFIDEVVGSMGPAAMRTLSDLVYDVLLAAGSHFTVPKGNLNTSNALSLDGFTKGIESFRKLKDERGNYMDLQPAVLLVPPQLEQVGKAILTSEYTERIATASSIDAVRPTGNPHRQAVQLEVEPRLSDAPTTWYLMAAPQASPMAVGFLGGKQSPTVEFFGLDADPSTLGVQWRVFHDFGSAMGDFRAAQKNTA